MMFCSVTKEKRRGPGTGGEGENVPRLSCYVLIRAEEEEGETGSIHGVEGRMSFPPVCPAVPDRSLMEPGPDSSPRVVQDCWWSWTLSRAQPHSSAEGTIPAHVSCLVPLLLIPDVRERLCQHTSLLPTPIPEESTAHPPAVLSAGERWVFWS